MRIGALATLAMVLPLAGCEGVSSSSYAVAAGFAAVAGAAQIAEAANSSQSTPPPPSPPASSPAAAPSPAPPLPPSGPLCTPQVVVPCFLGSEVVCVSDPRGCEICSCQPNGRYDWSNPR
jgi:hypothetical protein